MAEAFLQGVELLEELRRHRGVAAVHQLGGEVGPDLRALFKPPLLGTSEMEDLARSS